MYNNIIFLIIKRYCLQHEWILESSKIFISVILNISIQTVNGWSGYTIKNGFIVSTILFTLCTFPSVTDTLTFLSFLFSFQGFKNNYNKQGHAILNLNCADNANFILSSLVHVIRSIQQPFPRNLSCQFDNASNNKCNLSFGLFAYLVLEDIFYNVSHLFISNVKKSRRSTSPRSFLSE